MSYENHECTFLEIFIEDAEPSSVVKWCKECGSIVIDLEYGDGSIKEGKLTSKLTPDFFKDIDNNA